MKMLFVREDGAWKIARDKYIEELMKKGDLRPEESPFQFRDVLTGKPIHPHTGSVYWNAFRKRWIMILEEWGGSTSFIGEIWFVEADTPVGPWVYARKIVTHDKYDFYNPAQHPEFDREGGKRIFFEGTYVNTFSGNPVPTPRYNYNQIMYGLNLEDPRLALPAPVYRLKSGELLTGETLNGRGIAPDILEIPFYALPPSAKPPEHSVAIYLGANGLQATATSKGSKPLFYALTVDSSATAGTTPLKNTQGRELGRVWKNPLSALILDFNIIAE